MGTKIEYSINLLATSIDNNNFTVSGVDVWEHYQNKELTNNHYSIGVNKLQDPVDRMFDKNHMESIKKTMQMHEDIFKHQVRELHRVYSVQKMLMDEMKKETRQKKFWTPMNSTGISHPHFIQQQQQTTQISFGPDLHVQSLREDLSSKERSGSCSGETIKRQRGFDLERPAEGDIFAAAHGCDEGEAGPSSYTAFQRCKILSTDGCDEDMEVDLTLSIGGSQVKKKKKPYLLPLGCSDSPNGKTREFNSYVSFQSDRVGDYSDPTTPMSSSSVTFDQERKGPHWLSQGLKLK